MDIKFGDVISENIYYSLVELKTVKKIYPLCDALLYQNRMPGKAYLQCRDLQKMIDNGCKLVLYGLGWRVTSYYQLECEKKNNIGYLYVPFISEVNWYGFGDRRKEKYPLGFAGKKVKTMKEWYDEDPDIQFVIAMEEIYNECENEYKLLGGKRRLIQYEYPQTTLYEDEQYFDIFVPKIKDGVFIDGGSYDGKSIARFLKWNDGFENGKIYGFEIDSANYIKCKKFVSDNKWNNVKIFHAGLGEKDYLGFVSGTDSSGCRVTEKGEVSVEIRSIDSVFENNNERLSFIKLDVEGYELATLKGAEKTIKRDLPVIAVCLYHKPDDPQEIINFLCNLVDKYKYYIRFYSDSYLELVLYAIPIEKR